MFFLIIPVYTHHINLIQIEILVNIIAFVMNVDMNMYTYMYIFRKWMGFPVRPGHVGPKLEVHIAQLTACSLGPAPGCSGVGFEDSLRDPKRWMVYNGKSYHLYVILSISMISGYL